MNKPIVQARRRSTAKPSKDHHPPPLKDIHGNDGKESHCRCCPEHSPPKPKLTLMHCGHKKGGRTLVVCIDGTANQFGKKNTNVIELYNLIMKLTGDNQHTWYNSGIGTYARPHWRSFNHYQQVIFHKIDLAIAWNFDKTIQAAYRWLSDNYEDGDCIFLFGFSRGAFQVRTLSAMIDKVGLIHKGNEKQIPFAYELYADPTTDRPESEEDGSTLRERFKQALRSQEQQPRSSKPISMAERFKRTFSREDVKVHFVGAWDTVSSIGIVRGKRVLPGTTSGMTHVCYFRHALALDERRVKFLPEYAWGGTTLPPPGMTLPPPVTDEKRPPESNIQDGRNRKDGIPPQTLEVWFAGTHSDIGGGNVQNTGMDRSRPPLRWMAAEAEALGLRLKPFGRELSNKEQIEFRESLKGLWNLFELVPFRRLTFARDPGAKPNGDTFVPHLWSSRKIHAGQKIHSSLILADTDAPSGYLPKARPLSRRIRERIERDSTKDESDSESVSNEGGVERGLDRKDGRPRRFLRWLLSIRVRQTGDTAFWDDLRKDGLANSEGWLEIDVFDYARLLLKKLMDGEAIGSSLKEIVEKWDGAQALYDEVIEAIRLWKENSPNLEAQHRVLHTAIEILEGERENLELRKWREVRTPMGDILSRGLEDHRRAAERFLRHFTADVNCLFELRGHADWVMAIAVSCDGKQIVSSSDDETIRIWDLESGAQAGEPMRGHTDWVRSVAISPGDGKRIVSGSRDGTIRIWDVEKRAQIGETLCGHTSDVNSVAISKDGTRIVSGSSDGTIRIWDAETAEQVGEPLRGHSNLVSSVAISQDGTRIVSGSHDWTIRVWDVETGMQIGVPLRKHTGHVSSVAISPDGKRIVSGSCDQTIRKWDVEMGVQVGAPLRGHTDEVLSVTISSDGKRIVSGSQDDTIRIWDLETGAQVGEPLRGHVGMVQSVAVSLDCKRIVSGSGDRTIRIWNTEGIFL